MGGNSDMCTRRALVPRRSDKRIAYCILRFTSTKGEELSELFPKEGLVYYLRAALRGRPKGGADLP